MKVLLVSLNAKYIHSSLALRYIASYCDVFKENMEVLELTINHEENDIIKAIYSKQPDVVGFSCYIWNMEIVENIIPILKQIMPNIKIVLGGPEVSYNGQKLFEALPIDMVMENEGEPIWYDYMEHLLHNKMPLNEIKNIIYRDEKGNIVETPKRMPMNMADVPFVYDDLEGLEHKIMYYEGSRGCPFSCQYCLSSAEKGVRFLPLDRIQKELQYFLDHKVKQIKFVDRTFNANKKIAMAIWDYIIRNDNGHTNFHFEIAAELMDEEIFKLLSSARPGLIQFEIGVQSTNTEVLHIIQRPMPFEEIKKVVLEIKALGNIHQHLDLIAGLPLEDYSSFKKSFNDVMSVRPEQFQLGFLKLLKGSGLRENAEKYGIVYKTKPPYEVLYTKEMPYDSMLRLHQIEELVERYYNSERFHTSLEYLYTLFPSVFDFYEAFCMFWQEKEYDKVQHKKAAYYTILLEFALTLEGVNDTLIKELIRFDWYKHEQVKDLPKELLTIDQQPYKEVANLILRNDIFMIECLGIAEQVTARQRLRRMHMEWFNYDVVTREKKETVILFNYVNIPTWTVLTGEMLDEGQRAY